MLFPGKNVVWSVTIPESQVYSDMYSDSMQYICTDFVVFS